MNIGSSSRASFGLWGTKKKLWQCHELNKMRWRCRYSQIEWKILRIRQLPPNLQKRYPIRSKAWSCALYFSWECSRGSCVLRVQWLNILSYNALKGQTNFVVIRQFKTILRPSANEAWINYIRRERDFLSR